MKCVHQNLKLLRSTERSNEVTIFKENALGEIFNDFIVRAECLLKL